MIISTVEQGTPEWLAERAGNVSASNFDKIITTKGEKTSGLTRKTYLYQLAGERISGIAEEGQKTEWMQRGTELEGAARDLYESLYVEFVAQCGMVYLDDRKLISCSPDGLIGDDGGLEIKCPKLSTHIGYLDGKKMPTTYIQQVQGSLMVTGRNYWKFMSYHPAIKPFVVTVERDEKYIAIMKEAVEEFNAEVEKLVERMR
jgi:predicted phage-related endonuclease